MPANRIVRSQINELVQRILESSIPPASLTFTPAVVRNDLQLKLPLHIAFRDPSLYFDIWYSDSDYFGTAFFPNEKLEKASRWHKNWAAVVINFKTWLNVLQRETAEPDPWALLDEASILRDSIPPGGQGEAKFSTVELDRVHQFLSEARAFIVSEAELTAEQLKQIDERLSYLQESAKRQDKRDWAHTAVGVMFSIAIGLALAPEQANKLFQLTATFLESIFIKLLA